LAARRHKPTATKFCTSDAVHDVITQVNFGENRLRGFGVAMDRILHVYVALSNPALRLQDHNKK